MTRAIRTLGPPGGLRAVSERRTTTGLGADARLKVELLTHEERPIKGYAGADAAVVTQSGFQVPVTWKRGSSIRGLPERFRIKVSYEGAKMEDIRFYAFYVQPAKR